MPEATETAHATAATAESVAEQTAAVQFAPPTGPTVDAPATATLTYGGKEIELKVIPATEGSSGIEISKLLTTLGRDHPGPRLHQHRFDDLEGHLHRR